MYTCAHIRACTYAYTCTYTYTYEYAYTCIRIHIHMYTHTYTHTRIHTHALCSLSQCPHCHQLLWSALLGTDYPTRSLSLKDHVQYGVGVFAFRSICFL